jgi:hypothetical protein
VIGLEPVTEKPKIFHRCHLYCQTYHLNLGVLLKNNCQERLIPGVIWSVTSHAILFASSNITFIGAKLQALISKKAIFSPNLFCALVYTWTMLVVIYFFIFDCRAVE